MISIIIPTYNESINNVSEAINSVLREKKIKLEIIVILDNPENTELKRYLELLHVKNPEIRFFINENNKGVAETLNRGIRLSKGKYIARLDADDVNIPGRLKKQAQYLDNHKDISMVTGNCIYIDENGNEFGKKSRIPENPEKLLPYGSTIIHSSVMYRRSVVEDLGGYRKLLSSQDYDLWLRMIDKSYKIYSFNEYLVKYRIRDNSITVSESLRLMLTERYIRELRKERLKKGCDSYSYNNYIEFLIDNNYMDPENKEVFNESAKLFNTSINYLKNKKIILSLKFLYYSIKKDKRILERLKNMTIYYYKKQLYYSK
ncbi:glycosyltransferase [Vagococcus lutrae]|uniref:glycosyltransferase n=1 Tax=Vagococcus lutrae TaxID=81947 RepID=UPI0028904D71|nr:glycosyltransferase [Vagococcus lutrae]MDT2805866.1 glycosyltransferase [Vagococcus lutrae]